MDEEIFREKLLERCVRMLRNTKGGWKDIHQFVRGAGWAAVQMGIIPSTERVDFVEEIVDLAIDGYEGVKR